MVQLITGLGLVTFPKMSYYCLTFDILLARWMKRTIRIPDPLDQRIVELVDAEPRSIAERERVTPSSVIREALLRGVESLEQEVKPKRKGKR